MTTKIMIDDSNIDGMHGIKADLSADQDRVALQLKDITIYIPIDDIMAAIGDEGHE